MIYYSQQSQKLFKALKRDQFTNLSPEQKSIISTLLKSKDRTIRLVLNRDSGRTYSSVSTQPPARRPEKKEPKNARYVLLKHNPKEENHLGLQFLLTGIFSVYYDKSRTNVIRPGFTAFPSGRNLNRNLGIITAKIPAVITE